MDAGVDNMNDIVYIVEREPQIPDGSGGVIGVFSIEEEAFKLKKDYENSPYKWEINISKMQLNKPILWDK
jgi:hypothetical protein